MIRKSKLGGIESGAVSEEELEKINGFTLEKLGADDVFCFTALLCDNEVDRDFERFDAEALKGLAELFIGKPGTVDHSRESDAVAARIFDTFIVTDGERLTAAGEPYTALKARAYIPAGAGAEELISKIRSGIKKEVSVSCAVGSKVCSVCGKTGACGHVPGKKYGGKLCHRVLRDAVDAYEFSFVTVPAQPGAGVTKAFESEMEELRAENERLRALTGEEGQRLRAAGKAFAAAKRAVPALDRKAFSQLLRDCDEETLSRIEREFTRLTAAPAPAAPRLRPDRDAEKDIGEYKFGKGR